MWMLLSHQKVKSGPLNMSWPCNLSWSIVCITSNVLQFLSWGCKITGALTHLLLESSCPAGQKSRLDWTVVRETWRIKSTLNTPVPGKSSVECSHEWPQLYNMEQKNCTAETSQVTKLWAGINHWFTPLSSGVVVNEVIANQTGFDFPWFPALLMPELNHRSFRSRGWKGPAER